VQPLPPHLHGDRQHFLAPPQSTFTRPSHNQLQHRLQALQVSPSGTTAGPPGPSAGSTPVPNPPQQQYPHTCVAAHKT